MGPVGAAIDPVALLAVWEQGLGHPGRAREDALLRALPGDVSPPRWLGSRNARLLALHAQLFGRELALLSHCPACESAVEFEADCVDLALPTPAASAVLQRLDAGAHVIEFRLPDREDVEAASNGGREEDFALRLAERCVAARRRSGEDEPLRNLPAETLAQVSQRLESLDPGASVSFALVCPQCQAAWSAPLDVAQVVWQKVRSAAERLLLDVDALARAYGWSEAEILRLGPMRRAAYVQMVTA